MLPAGRLQLMPGLLQRLVRVLESRPQLLQGRLRRLLPSAFSSATATMAAVSAIFIRTPASASRTFRSARSSGAASICSAAAARLRTFFRRYPARFASPPSLFPHAGSPPPPWPVRFPVFPASRTPFCIRPLSFSAPLQPCLIRGDCPSRRGDRWRRTGGTACRPPAVSFPPRGRGSGRGERPPFPGFRSPFPEPPFDPSRI